MAIIPAGLALMAAAMLVTFVGQLKALAGPRGERDEVAPEEAA
jgi:hypothetical protein